MFESEIAVNENLLAQFEKIVADIPEETLFKPSAGHGHSPVWLLGHLAIVGEAGQRMVGGKITHTEWLRLFGPGSVDNISLDPNLTKSLLAASVTDAYSKLRSLAFVTDEANVSRPHGIAILTGTPIVTVKHCLTHLLTSHFAFHLSQLSSCRRAAGFPALF
ncbi:MAG: DinB family protein [Schlesneria sp.]